MRTVAALGVSLAALLAAGVAVAGRDDAAPAARTPAPEANCSGTGPRDGCVTAIRFADPRAISETRAADGSVHGTWTTAGGVTETLPRPLTIEQAAARAFDEAAAHGLARPRSAALPLPSP